MSIALNFFLLSEIISTFLVSLSKYENQDVEYIGENV